MFPFFLGGGGGINKLSVIEERIRMHMRTQPDAGIFILKKHFGSFTRVFDKKRKPIYYSFVSTILI